VSPRSLPGLSKMTPPKPLVSATSQKPSPQSQPTPTFGQAFSAPQLQPQITPRNGFIEQSLPKIQGRVGFSSTENSERSNLGQRFGYKPAISPFVQSDGNDMTQQNLRNIMNQREAELNEQKQAEVDKPEIY